MEYIHPVYRWVIYIWIAMVISVLALCAGVFDRLDKPK